MRALAVTLGLGLLLAACEAGAGPESPDAGSAPAPPPGCSPDDLVLHCVFPFLRPPLRRHTEADVCVGTGGSCDVCTGLTCGRDGG